MATFTLPSKGLLYPADHPLRSGIIELREMKASDEQVLSKGTSDILDKLLNRCITTENVDVKDLVGQDVQFLLYMLRSISYGEKYEFQIKCPDCQNKNHYTVDIQENMAVNELNANELGPFTVELSKNIITWDYISGKVTHAVLQRMKRLKKVRREDEGEYIYMYAAAIKTIDGVEVTPKDAIEFVKELSVRDSAEIEESMLDHKFGIVEKFILECEDCLAESEVSVPMTETFFRTSRKRDKR